MLHPLGNLVHRPFRVLGGVVAFGIYMAILIPIKKCKAYIRRNKVVPQDY